jgi:hypothetical protein
MHECKLKMEMKQMDELMLSQRDSPPASVGTVDVNERENGRSRGRQTARADSIFTLNHAATTAYGSNIAQRNWPSCERRGENGSDR